MADEEVVIVPYKDGPYVIRGPVVLQDQDGTSITLNRRTIALCRCGKSRMRPFCDGTHHVIRFRAGSSVESPPGPGRAAGEE
jgi:CDGSH-type Zn-finger protein